MSVPNSLGLKEVQMGAHDFKLNKVPLFTLKSVNINVLLSVAPKLAFVPASCYMCEVQMGAHDFKLNKVPLFALKSVNINVLLSADPKLLCLQAVTTAM